MSGPTPPPAGLLGDEARALLAAWTHETGRPVRAGVPVVLVLHGTRDESGRAEQRDLVRLLEDRYPGSVHAGVIEWTSPGLPPVFTALASAAREARANRAGEVRIVPYLMFPAGHARDDMRAVVRGARLLHPDIRFRCMPLLGPGPRMTEALTDRIREAETAAARRADAILVVGRGSSVAYANRRLQRFVAGPVHAADGRPVASAFGSLADPPVSEGLAALWAGGASDIVVLPVLLNAGHFTRLIARQAREFAAAHESVTVTVSSHLHGHPAMLGYLEARCRGERGRAPARPVPAAAAREPATERVTASRTAASPCRPVVVAGTASGIGKTTVALGLMSALRRRGLRVQPFKVGPDYIDPLYHTEICGRTSRNLDGVLCSPLALPALVGRAMRGADVGVVEGVLGLFDGRLGGGDAGSTAEVARVLDADVVLVIDAARSSRSVGAVALGFARFDPRVRLAGVILNRVGSERHEAAAREAVEAVGVRVLGALPRDDRLGLPERYLGLVPPQEHAMPRTWVEQLGAEVERRVDVDAILRSAGAGAGRAVEPDPLHDPFALPARGRRARVALARDAAFSFVYQDAIDLLTHLGAEVVPFSPLVDPAPPACGAMWLPGGFPERFAAQLEANRPMRASIAAAAAAGVPVVAECGGAMLLGTHITTEDGSRHAMCGVLPHGTRMGRSRRALGYRTATALRASPLLASGETVVGHEFHWSTEDPGLDPDQAAWTLRETGGAAEGWARPTALATYLHVHLAGAGPSAARLVAAAERTEAAMAGSRLAWSGR